MTNQQQSLFFIAIIFLFAAGIGLVIYRQYDEYYQQQAQVELEAAAQLAVPHQTSSVSKMPASH